MLECVVNISEGRDAAVLAVLRDSAGSSLLDVHSDGDHHRSVFTLAGPDVERDTRRLAEAAVKHLDIRRHSGVHPRLGVVDVVPFVPLPDTDTILIEALAARDRFAAWFAETLDVPSFFYGPERSLPAVRKEAFDSLLPDAGPNHRHTTAGATAVGARLPLVAYNLWLSQNDLKVAQGIATSLRSSSVRTLALEVGNHVQVSCNLIDPEVVGPGDVYAFVAGIAHIDHAELVGLLPRKCLLREERSRWKELGLSEDFTIEARLTAAGLNRGKI